MSYLGPVLVRPATFHFPKQSLCPCCGTWYSGEMCPRRYLSDHTQPHYGRRWEAELFAKCLANFPLPGHDQPASALPPTRSPTSDQE